MLFSGGEELSGGERQLIILARALTRNFNILILDETLSEVNDELEDKILEKYNNKTLVTIFFYKSEHIYILKGIISKINTATKEITVNNQKVIFFSNIIRII